MSFVIAPRHTKKVTLSFCAWWYIRFFHNRRRWPLHCIVVNVVNSSCDLIPGCAMVGGSFVVQHGAVTIATVTDKNANRTRASTWMVAVITVKVVTLTISASFGRKQFWHNQYKKLQHIKHVEAWKSQQNVRLAKKNICILHWITSVKQYRPIIKKLLYGADVVILQETLHSRINHCGGGGGGVVVIASTVSN